jgi:DNA-binding HxlR family transcriptional regulator
MSNHNPFKAFTEIGTELVPICDNLHKWGTKHRLEHTGIVSKAVHKNTNQA